MAADPVPTLASMLERLGRHVLRSATRAALLDVRVGDPVVHGRGEPVPRADHGILLMTGAAPDTDDVVRAAAQSGYCAVVVKEFGRDLAASAAVAEAAGVALLATPDDMAWRQLDALITAGRTALTATGDDRYREVGIGDLFALANAIAAGVGGAVVIEEPGGRMLAYSNLPDHEIDDVRRRGILGRQTPDLPYTAGNYREVLSGDGAVLVPAPAPEVAERLAVTVRAGARVLGMIWVISDRPPLVPDAAAQLVDAARSAALHLLRARGQRDPERALRGESVALLLDGALSPAAAATRLSLPLATSTVVLAIAPVEGRSEQLLSAARIVDLVALYGEAWHPAACCAAVGGIVHLLLPADTRAESGVVKLATDMVDAVQRTTGVEVVAAIGPVVASLAGVPQARLMTDRVLQVLLDAPALRVATLEQVHSRIVLRALAEPATATDLLLPQVQAVVEHDAAHGTAYVQTLLAYLGALGDVVTAAGRLLVHDNTLRYRVRRVQEMFGLDLTDPDQVLATWLQLRLVDVDKAGGGDRSSAITRGRRSGT